MAHAASGASFLLESLSDSGVGGKLRLEYFNGDLFINRDVTRAIDFAHAAGAEWFFEQVLVREGNACEPARETV
jgi:hypothetical protein